MTDSIEHVLHGNEAAESFRRLQAHAATATIPEWGDRSGKPLTVIRHSNTNLVGCACGIVCPGWLHLELMWVEFKYRNQGIGRELLTKIEAEAVTLGAHSAYLWTQEYEAPGFYSKYGYEQFAELPEFGKGHQLIAMRKRLVTDK